MRGAGTLGAFGPSRAPSRRHSTNGSKLVDRLSNETLPVAHQQRTTFDPANTRILLADQLLEVRPRPRDVPAAAQPQASPAYVQAGGRTPFVGMADSQRSLPDEEAQPLPPPPPPLFSEPAAAPGDALRTPAPTLPPTDAAASPIAGFTAGLTQLLPPRAAPDTLLVGGARAALPLGDGTDGRTIRLSFGNAAVARPSAPAPALPTSAPRGALGLALHSPLFGHTIAGGRSPLVTGRDGGGPFGAAAAQPAFGGAAWRTEGQVLSSQQADAVAVAPAAATLLPEEASPPEAEAAGPTMVLDFDFVAAEATLGAAAPSAPGAETQVPAGADTQVPAGADTQLPVDEPVMFFDEPAGATLELPAALASQAAEGAAPSAPNATEAAPMGDEPPHDAATTAPDYVSSLPDFFTRSIPPEAAADPAARAPPSQHLADSAIAKSPALGAAAASAQQPDASAPRVAAEHIAEEPAPQAAPSQSCKASAPFAAAKPVTSEEPALEAAPSRPAEASPPAAAEASPPAAAAAPSAAGALAPDPAASHDSDVTVDEPGDAPTSLEPGAVSSERALPPSLPMADAVAPAALPPAAVLPASESPAGHSGRPSQLAGALFGAGMSSLPSSQNASQFAAAAVAVGAAMQAAAAPAAASPPVAVAAEDSDVTIDEPSPAVAAGPPPPEVDAVDSAARAAPVLADSVLADSEPGDGTVAGATAGTEPLPAPLQLNYETMLQPPARHDSSALQESFGGGGASGSPDLEGRGLFETQCPVDARQIAGAWHGVGGFIPFGDPLALTNVAPPSQAAPAVAPSPPPVSAALAMPPPPPRFPAPPAGSPSPAVIRDGMPARGVGETQREELPVFAHFIGATNAAAQLADPPPPEEGAAAVPAHALKPTAAEGRKAAAAKKRENAAAPVEPEKAKAHASATRPPRQSRGAAVPAAADEEVAVEPAAAAAAAAAAAPPAKAAPRRGAKKTATAVPAAADGEAEAEPAAAAPQVAKAAATPRRGAKAAAASARSSPAKAAAGAAEAEAAPPPRSARRGRGTAAPATEAACDDVALGTQELVAAPAAEPPAVEVEGTQELPAPPAARGGRKSAAAAAAPAPAPAPAPAKASPPGARAKRGRKQPADVPEEADAGGAAALAPRTAAGRGSKRAKVSAAAEAQVAAALAAEAAALEPEAAKAEAPPPLAARGGRGKKTASPAKPAEASPPAAKAGRGQKRPAAASVDVAANPAAAEEDGGVKRRRAGSDSGDVRILMSSNLPVAEARKLRDKLNRLPRVTVLDDKDESLSFTHFLMSSSAGGFKRTRNALAALASARPIVAPTWVEACVAAGTVVDASSHLLYDLKAEREFKFTMQGAFGAPARTAALQVLWLF